MSITNGYLNIKCDFSNPDHRKLLDELKAKFYETTEVSDGGEFQEFEVWYRTTYNVDDGKDVYLSADEAKKYLLSEDNLNLYLDLHDEVEEVHHEYILLGEKFDKLKTIKSIIKKEFVSYDDDTDRFLYSLLKDSDLEDDEKEILRKYILKFISDYLLPDEYDNHKTGERNIIRPKNNPEETDK